MLTASLAAFEIRYQLKNPVFWVSVAIFFLIGFGLSASDNLSIGTPGSVHENSPFAVTIALALLGLFYLFVITSFVANAVVRDDTTGFGRPFCWRVFHCDARLSGGAARHRAGRCDAVG
jgi:ABC-2 type transport system permease protein